MTVAQADVPAAVLRDFGIMRYEYNGTSFRMKFLEQDKYIKDVRVSRFPVASSARMTAGLFTSARAMATRCICPPDIWLDLCSNRSPRPTACNASMARRRRSEALTDELYISGNSTFPQPSSWAASCSFGRRSRFPVSQYGTLRLAHGAHGDVIEQILPAGRSVQTAQRVEQCGLSRTGSTHDGHKLTFVNGERNAP